MTPTERRDKLRDLEIDAARTQRLTCKFRTYFPDTGPLRRELYPRSLEFFAGGGVRNADGSYRYRERGFMGANRTSKTVTAAFEVTTHLTGAYPAWWPGRKFESPTRWWAAGDSRETTRDIIQLELFGPREDVRLDRYTGMVPGHLVGDRALKQGMTDCLDLVWIKHREREHGAPCFSTLQFKSYDQGRKSFQGTTLTGGVWLDEEPPDVTEDTAGGGTPSGNGDIYTECLLRTATTEGMIIATFVPLRGLTPFIDSYLETADMIDADGRIVNAKMGMFGEAEL